MSSESEEEVEYGQRQCLPVGKLSASVCVPFTDVELDDLTPQQYLGMVRFEASKYPDIVTSDLVIGQQQEQREEQEDDPFLPIDGQLELDWVYQYLYEFSELRENFQCAQCTQCIEEYPTTLNAEKWLLYCLGNGKLEGKPPLISVMKSMSDALAQFAFDVLVEYFEGQQQFDEMIFCWLFALLVALQYPLQPTTYGNIRSLLRSCVKLLSDGCEEWKDQLKVLVVVCGGYFGQSQKLCAQVDFEVI
eukprot:TRINITY_DN2970_c1_g1_i1.p2 TRINITY_DN2970_c1_g1~~TRINITY_DN2970_c1_g1_i1.p2  ORF type:complete len:247 (-),score=31.71 TRINITY_DN2970_c1_g1_i1:148-888(-)